MQCITKIYNFMNKKCPKTKVQFDTIEFQVVKSENL